MNRRACRVLCLGAAVLVGSGCPEPVPKLRIGAIYALTGPAATAGQNQLDAAAVAALKINEAGGVLGRHLEIHVRDDASNPDKAADMARELIQVQGVKALLGSNPSSNTVRIAAVASAAQVVQISSGSVSREITTLADDGYVFRTVPADVYQYRLQASRAYAKGFRRVAILYVPNLTGITPADAFEQAFTQLGGTITFKKAWVENQVSYRSYLDEVYATDPEACTLIGPVTDSARIIQDYVLAYVSRGTFWFFMNSQNQDFVIGAGPQNFTFPHEGTRPTVRAQNDRFPFFESAFKEVFSVSPNNYGQSNAFDAVYLLALAMQAAGEPGLTDQPQLIRDKMYEISRPGGAAHGPAGYRDAVAAVDGGGDIDYQGASGSVDFDANGDVLGGFDIWQVRDGVQVNIETDIPPPP